jgi:hypothetical protein
VQRPDFNPAVAFGRGHIPSHVLAKMKAKLGAAHRVIWLVCAILVAACSRYAPSTERQTGQPGQPGGIAGSAQPSKPPATSRTAPSPSTPAEFRGVQIEMKRVHMRLDDGIVLDVARLRGEMVSRVRGRPPVFDDQRSYVLRVAAAEISIDMMSLSRLMNRYVFGYPGAPLKEIEVRAEDGRLVQRGKLHKGVDISFSTTSTVTATPDGRLRLQVESMKAAGIPAKGLLGAFGLELDDLVDLKDRRGVEIDENSIVISPGEVTPPPQITGRIASATIRGDRLVQTFAPANGREPAAITPRDSRHRNYLYLSGGSIQFGKLVMMDTDLELIDMDPSDPFDFYPARYDRQLVAGYSKVTPGHGLRSFLPDYDDLGRASTPHR